MFFDLAPAVATVNDTNARLVNFYRVVRERSEALVERLRALDDPETVPDPEQAFAVTDWSGDPVETYYAESGFQVDRERATRSINSDAAGRGEVEEIIATNVPRSVAQSPDSVVEFALQALLEFGLGEVVVDVLALEFGDPSGVGRRR